MPTHSLRDGLEFRSPFAISSSSVSFSTLLAQSVRNIEEIHLLLMLICIMIMKMMFISRQSQWPATIDLLVE